MSKRYLVFFALLACLTGCVPVDSLNPLYTDKNVIFDPALAGKWVSGNPEDGVLRFDRGEEDAYQMVFTQKTASGHSQETVYVAHLVSLGGEKYLDVSPKQFDGTAQQYLFRTDGSKKGSMFRPVLERISDGIYLEVQGPIPGKGNSQELQLKLRSSHWIFKVYLSEKTLSLSYLDQQWVEEAIKKKLLQAEHLKARSENSAQWLLSGSTAELQQFVVQHADDPGAFTGGIAMSKIE
ncbi:MAG TPA: hypothetical protein VGJ30_13445 [Candidatus Angelobacter sp.]